MERNLPVLDNSFLNLSESSSYVDMSYMRKEELLEIMKKESSTPREKTLALGRYYSRVSRDIGDNIQTSIMKINSNKSKIDEDFIIFMESIKTRNPNIYEDQKMAHMLNLVYNSEVNGDNVPEAFYNKIAEDTFHKPMDKLTSGDRVKMKRFIDEAIKEAKNVREVADMNTKILLNQKSDIINSGLYDRTILDSLLLLEQVEFETNKAVEFTKDLSFSNNRITGIRCECCKRHGREDSFIELQNNLIAFVSMPTSHSSSNIFTIPLANKCPECSSIVMLDMKYLDKVHHQNFYTDIVGNNSSSIKTSETVKCYIPSRIDLYNTFSKDSKHLFETDLLNSNLLESGEEEDNTFSELESNKLWLSAVKDFYKNLDAKISILKDSRNVKGISDIARLVGELFSDYDQIKEDAVNTVLVSMDKLGFSIISSEKDDFQTILKSIENLDDVKKEYLDDFLPLLAIKSTATKAEIIAEMKRVMNYDYSDLVKEYVREFNKNLPFLLGIKIIKDVPNVNALREKYLYNQELVDLVDVWSDLLIISNHEEEIFNNTLYTMTRGDSTKLNHDVGLNMVKKRIMNINLVNFLEKNSNAFYDKINIDVKENFFSKIKTSKQLEVLENICKSVLRQDYYDTVKYLKEYQRTNPAFKPFIIDYLMSTVDFSVLNKSKFDYYFNFECNKIEQEEFLYLLYQKKFVPKEVKGATVKAKLNNYRKMTKRPEDCIEFPRDIWNICLKNSTELNSLSVCNSYNSFGMSFTMRNMILNTNWDESTFDNYCNIFSIDKETAILLINSCDYKLEVINSKITLGRASMLLPVYYSKKMDLILDKSSPENFVNELLSNQTEVINYLQNFKGLNNLFASLF